MKDEIKEIYLSNLDWIKTHDNMGGVMGHVVFKDNMSYEEYNKLFKSIYFVLCNKDYITNLQEENKELKEKNYLLIDYQDMEIRYNDYKSRNEKAIEYINNKWKKDKYYEDIENCMTFCLYDKDDLLKILQGEDKDE